MAQVAGALAAVGGAAPTVDASTRRVTVPVDSGSLGLLDAVRSLDHLAIAIDDISLRRPTLDEVFLTLTGRPAVDAADPAAPAELADPTAAGDASAA